jgi:hypothetical protein
MTKVGFRADVPLRGDLRIIRRDANTHNILDVWEKKNVITFVGVEALVKLMAPNAAFGATVQQESQIKSMRFGTSNIAPQRTDTGLATEAVVGGNAVRVQLLDANRVVGASGTVEFTALLDSGTGNGVTYREAGLFTRGTADDPLTTTGSSMFSRQVYPDQPKTAAVELEFRWRISFTV